MALLSGAFGLLAMVLASVGLYGVIAYGVEAAHTGNRHSAWLSAPAACRCRGCCLREVGMLLAVGLVLGGAGTLAMGQWVRAMLFGLTPRDPAMLIAAALLLSAVAIVAGYLPARPSGAARSDGCAAAGVNDGWLQPSFSGARDFSPAVAEPG